MSALRMCQYFATAWVLLLANSALAASKLSNAETTSVTVTYRIYLTETGVPEKFEFVSIKPPLGSSVQSELKEAFLKAVRTWSFTPKKKHGKAVAGWVVVPVIMDLADPIPVAGGT